MSRRSTGSLDGRKVIPADATDAAGVPPGGGAAPTEMLTEVPVPPGSSLRWIAASELLAAPAEAFAGGGLGGPVVVLLPWLDEAAARQAAAVMLARAGTACSVLALRDDARLGPVALLNAAMRRTDSPWIVYAAQDAFAGRHWLHHALTTLQAEPGRGLLAFNDGKWFGHLAGFGLVRRRWIDAVYGGDLFHPGYRRHYGDTELSLIAQQDRALAYHPHALLVEVDADKDARAVHAPDRELFRLRAGAGFDGRVTDPVLLKKFG